MALTLLVMIHELGHYTAAKLFGVRVDRFYLFFNPGFSLLKYKPSWSETEFGIGWIPLGGYVKLAGMIDESMDTRQMQNPPQPWEFRTKPAWQRLVIMFAGVFNNFVLAVVVYAMLLYVQGEKYLCLQDVSMGMDYVEIAHEYGFCDGDILLSADGVTLQRYDETSMRQLLNAREVSVLREGDTVRIPLNDDFARRLIANQSGLVSVRIPFVMREIIAGSPAERAGLQAGDSLVSVNGESLLTQGDFVACFKRHASDTVQLGYVRGGTLCTTALVPDSAGKIGVYCEWYDHFYPVRTHRYGFWASFPAGIVAGWHKLTGYADDMKWVFTREGASSLGGFGTMAKLFPDTFDWVYFWNLCAYLSVILAFMNILPIPGLDGGHILFLLFETVTGRKLSDRFMAGAQIAGMTLLIMLLFYANGMDLLRWLLG